MPCLLFIISIFLKLNFTINLLNVWWKCSNCYFKRQRAVTHPATSLQPVLPVSAKTGFFFCAIRHKVDRLTLTESEFHCKAARGGGGWGRQHLDAHTATSQPVGERRRCDESVARFSQENKSYHCQHTQDGKLWHAASEMWRWDSALNPHIRWFRLSEQRRNCRMWCGARRPISRGLWAAAIQYLSVVFQWNTHRVTFLWHGKRFREWREFW